MRDTHTAQRGCWLITLRAEQAAVELPCRAKHLDDGDQVWQQAPLSGSIS